MLEVNELYQLDKQLNCDSIFSEEQDKKLSLMIQRGNSAHKIFDLKKNLHYYLILLHTARAEKTAEADTFLLIVLHYFSWSYPCFESVRN